MWNVKLYFCHIVVTHPTGPRRARHCLIIWEEGQTSAYYCRNPPVEAGTKLYCLVTEAHVTCSGQWRKRIRGVFATMHYTNWRPLHVCEQLPQGRYLALQWAGIEPRTNGSPVRHVSAKPPSHAVRYRDMAHIHEVGSTRALKMTDLKMKHHWNVQTWIWRTWNERTS